MRGQTWPPPHLKPLISGNGLTLGLSREDHGTSQSITLLEKRQPRLLWRTTYMKNHSIFYMKRLVHHTKGNMHTLSYHKTDENNLFPYGTALGATSKCLKPRVPLQLHRTLYRLGTWREDINHAIGVWGNVHVGGGGRHKKQAHHDHFLVLDPPFKNTGIRKRTRLVVNGRI
jgi:hypothetical protein